MQGRCWIYNLSNGRQSNENYLNDTRKLQTDKDCPQGTYCDWSTIYSSLGMSIHAVENSQEVLFGAPGTYAWKGAIGVKKWVNQFNSKSIVLPHFRGTDFVLGDKLKKDPSSIYDYAGYAIDSGTKYKIHRMKLLIT